MLAATTVAMSGDFRFPYPLPRVEAKLISNLLAPTLYTTGTPYHPRDHGDIKAMLTAFKQLEQHVRRMKAEVFNLSSTYHQDTMDIWW